MLKSGFAYCLCFSKSRIKEEGVLGLELLRGRADFLVCVLPWLEPPEECRGLLLLKSMKWGHKLPSRDVLEEWKDQEFCFVLLYFAF